MWIVGVDPGIKGIGIALIEHLKNGECSYVKGLLLVETNKDVSEVVRGASGVFVNHTDYITTDDTATSFADHIVKEWFEGLSPACAVIEKGIFTGFGNEVLLVAGWCGAVLYKLGVSVHFVNPSTVKSRLMGKGKGRSKKNEVEAFVRSKLNLVFDHPPSNKYAEHLWDAMLYGLYNPMLYGV
jgi:Holliday junction resolvasome RuvABC endonuclease subunit